MQALATIDYLIIIGFLVITLVAGTIMTKKASSSLDHYFLGGRTLPWYLLGVAGATTWFDLTGTMIITSFLYMLGPSGLYVEFRGGAALVLVFMLTYTGKWHRRSGCMTSAEWMTYRFGEGKAAEGLRLISALVGILITVMILAYLIRGATLFLGMFFPFPAMYSTLTLVIVSTFFTLSAGFYGVVLTDLVQGIIIIVASVIIAILAWNLVPSTASLAETALQVTGNSAWSNSHPAWHLEMPAGYDAYSLLIMVAGLYFLRSILGGFGSGAEPRYFASKSDRDCGLQSLMQGVILMFRWPLMLGFAVMGIYLVHSMYPDPTVIHEARDVIQAQYPDTSESFWHDLTSNIVSSPGNHPDELINDLQALLGPEWKGKLALVGFHGTVNPEQILPAALLNMVPTGLKGLIVVAMFAALMSTQTGFMNVASALFVKDIYQNFLRPKAENRELIITSYISTLAIICVSFYFGVFATNINNLWAWIMMSLTAGQVGPQLLRLYWSRCNAWGMIAGMALGAGGAMIQRAVYPGMNEFVQFMLMTTLSFAGTIAGSLLTAPTPHEVLKNFYRTIRPFGLWGPLRGEFQGAERRAIDRENLMDIVTLPFALIWLVTMLLLPMQLVIKAYEAFFWTLPLFLVGVAGMYFFWWKPLMRKKA